ncbi:MAG TPA: ribonuclease J, partial [Polyangiaceae bacterium]|nr:ribonuclease J [Polyangiaceae bacterium]
MTVVEYDERIVVVDVGLRFPTPEMVGIDLVLPDFTYLRERAREIEAIVVTHGHEDHLGALPWVLRELASAPHSPGLPPVYGGALTMAMARSKIEEHKLRDVQLEEVQAGETLELGPFSLELVHMTHSIPDSSAVALGTDLGTVLMTGDYKFDQTPVDGPPADVSRLAELGREGVLLLCGDSTNVDREGFSPSESVV